MPVIAGRRRNWGCGPRRQIRLFMFSRDLPGQEERAQAGGITERQARQVNDDLQRRNDSGSQDLSRRENHGRIARPSLTHEARDAYGTPWPEWIRSNTDQLNQAQRQGEIGSDVNTVDQAHQISGTRTGLVLTGHSVYGDFEGLEERIAARCRNIMTVTAHPRILLKIDFSPTAGRDLYQAFLDRQS
ncbi:hypothetical protein NOD94_001385 [Streptomyces sp. Isolate_45]|nr:hypothetical protein [Streptomyces sp. Isolate_45]